MKPVEQTRFGGPDAPVAERGNCTEACVASVLELKLEEVPDTHAKSDWLKILDRFLAPRNLGIIEVNVPEDGWIAWWPTGVFHLASVPSPTLPGVGHSVVCRDGEVVWDPRPDRDTYELEPATIWTMFVVRNPAGGVQGSGRPFDLERETRADGAFLKRTQDGGSRD